MQKIALDTGIIEPRTIVDISSLKLHFKHVRAELKVVKMIQTNEDNARVLSKHSKSTMVIEQEYKFKNVSWSDEIKEKPKRRDLK